MDRAIVLYETKGTVMYLLELRYRETLGDVDGYVGPFNTLSDAETEKQAIIVCNGNDYSVAIVQHTCKPITLLPHGVETHCHNCPHDAAPGTVYLYPVYGNPYHYM